MVFWVVKILCFFGTCVTVSYKLVLMGSSVLLI